jgi:hypothetical protein
MAVASAVLSCGSGDGDSGGFEPTGSGGAVGLATGGGTGFSGGASGGPFTTGGAFAGGTSNAGGTPGIGGLPGTGGMLATGGFLGTGGVPVATGGESNAGGEATGGGGGGVPLAAFSFFVTSLSAIRSLSGSPQGFGGDLRYGQPTGLAGADVICTEIAERSMPGAGGKQWRAFLSTSTENARDRVGAGPWYDRQGRLVARTLNDLLGERPGGADPVIANDLPNEDGAPNRAGSAEGIDDDNHDTITGSTRSGTYAGAGTTCDDWTSTSALSGRPVVGHSWPANSGTSWIQAHPAPGCEPSVAIVRAGRGTGTGIGNGGGYGGFYCLALSP